MARAPAPPPVLYRETRISPTPPSPTTVLTITAGAPSSAFRPAAGQKRAFDLISGNDEETYARKHLATEGSVFFRSKDRTPRSFLWRVLNERQLLEVQCVDLIAEKKQQGGDCWLAFHIFLPSRILPGGVVLADAVEKDALDIFILSGDDLYTVQLPRQLLTRETVPPDFDSNTLVKKFSTSAFHRARPYRMIAVTSLELFVSLQDGSLLRLDREANESASHWRETFFSEGGWSGTLKRNLVPWGRPKVKYGDTELDSSASAAIAKSPRGRFVWTVSLDHNVRAWDTETGKVVAQIDILDENLSLEDKKRQGHYIMPAEQGTLLQIAPSNGADGVDYFLVLHSPKEHQFKFYGVSETAEPDGSISMADAQPRIEPLIPPIAEMLGTNIWHLEQFYVAAGKKWQDSQIWLRARSGALCRTFTLNFNLLSETGAANDMSDLWQKGWSVVDSSSSSMEALKALPDFVSLDPSVNTIATPTEKWLEFLFYPGRFTEASLETALHVYRKGRNLSSSSNRALGSNPEPLKERITAAVASKILLRRLANEQPDFDRYQHDLLGQWHTFFTLLSSIHTRRHESLGFAFDADDLLPWTVSADFVAPIRLSSDFEMAVNNADMVLDFKHLNDDGDYDPTLLERIWHNNKEEYTKSAILGVARLVRHYMSPASQETLRSSAILDALNQAHERSAANGLQLLTESCTFGEDITDEDFAVISDSADVFNGLGSLSDDAFLAVLEALDDTPLRGVDHHKILRRYGKDMVIALAQETLHQTRAILLDILALIVFMHGELEQEELSEEFRPTEIYDAIMLRLKCTELRLWLVSRVRLEPKKLGSKKDDLISMTLYESFFIGDWDAKGPKGASTPELITAWTKRWTVGLDLNTQMEQVTEGIMSSLLKAKQNNLAGEFVKFLNEDASWSTYLKGRLHLATGDYAMAGLCFQEAAEDMAHIPTPDTTLEHSFLLDDFDLQHFGCGVHNYYKHVSSLFEALRVFSYSADFAYLALKHFPQTSDQLQRGIVELDKRKSAKGSPAITRVENAGEELQFLRLIQGHDDILSALFTGLVETGRFEEAYQALVQFSKPGMKKGNLAKLIRKCIDGDAVPILLGLPIQGDLVQLADAELLSLAKRNMGTSNKQLSGPPYHKILFAFRSQNRDFRGAAALLYLHLQYLKHTNPQALQDPDDETLIQVYVLLINTMACCDDEEAWLLAEPITGVHPEGTKRKLVRLEDVRREYVAELDRRSDIQMGRFGVVGGDEMDVF